MKDQTFYNVVALVAAGIIVLSFLAGIYGAEMGASRSSSTTTGSNPTLPTGVPVSFTLRAYLSGFVGVGGAIDGLRDPTLYVGWGDNVTVTLVDGQAMEHDFYLNGYDVQTPILTGVNQSASLTFRATVKGSFGYICTIPGHAAAGMNGTLVVGYTPIGAELPLTSSRVSEDPSAIPPPITRNTSTTVDIYLHAVEETAEVEPGVSYTYWTYNGTVPGPFFRVRVGDTVTVHFSNDRTSSTNQSVDFQAVTGPGGGAAVTQTPPGGERNFTFLAMTPGLFVYQSGTPNIPTGIANGMFGMILVQPAQGLPAVAHEFYLMESELYLHWPIHTPGNQLFNGSALLGDDPTYVVFNGAFDSLTGAHALKVNVNDSIRIFFGEAGPNDFSAFSMVGATFNETYLYGDLTDPPTANLQTVPVPPGSTAMIDLTAVYPGNYSLIDHQLGDVAAKGALATLNVTGPANSSIFHTGVAPLTVAASAYRASEGIAALPAVRWIEPGAPGTPSANPASRVAFR
jgi:nitrite reductase (NO-forming)